MKARHGKHLQHEAALRLNRLATESDDEDIHRNENNAENVLHDGYLGFDLSHRQTA